MSQTIEQIKSINLHFRRAIEQVGEGIVVVEAERSLPLGPRIVFANRAAAELSGHSVADLLDRPLGLIYEPERLDDLMARLPRVADSGRPFQMNRELAAFGGRRVPCRWTVSAVRGAKGQPVNYILTMSPLLREASVALAEPRASAPADPDLEEGLEKSRVESLALLAAGIAHDFNNALQTILTNLSLAKMSTSAGTLARDHVEHALAATSDAQSLARQILDFTKGREPVIQVVNLSDVVRGVAKLTTMGSQVRCDITSPEGVWGVEVDLRQIRQVIHNLMVNACQAMPTGGVVQAFVQNVMVPSGNALGLAPGPFVVVRVRDRGCGIPAEELGKIFEAYYTTKKNGTGIGLATCRAIIQRHGGVIAVTSKVKVGSEFSVFLPACQVFEETGMETADSPGETLAPPARGALDGGHARQSGQGRVLVVDDQDTVREAAERLLQALGYETVTAATGQEAVGIFRQHARSGQAIDAVLLDMTLPGGLSGSEVMRELLQEDARARVIATSGYFDDSAEEVFRREGYVGILPKPYGVERLSQRLAEAIMG